MIEQLDELLAVGFGGKQSDLVSEMLTKVKRDEHNIGVLIRDLHRALFSIEDQLRPVSVMFWHRRRPGNEKKGIILLLDKFL